MENAEKILTVLISPIENSGYIGPKSLEQKEIPEILEEEELSVAEEMKISGNLGQSGALAKERRTKRFFKKLVRPLKSGANKILQREDGGENKENSMRMSNMNSVASNTSLKQNVVDMRGKLEFYANKYQQQTKKYEEELKRCKDILNLMRHLIDNQDSYLKEKRKFLAFEPSHLRGESLMKYWKTLRETICTTKNINVQLFEKMCAIEKRFSDFVRNAEDKVEEYDSSAQKAIKSISRMVKYHEEQYSQEPSFKHSLKRMLHMPGYEANPSILGASARLPTENDLDLDFFEGNESVFKGLEFSLTSKKQVVKSMRQKELILKKDTIIAYMQCYNKQKDQFRLLGDKVDTISHCIEENVEIISGLAVVEKQIEASRPIPEAKKLELSVSSINMSQMSAEVSPEKVPETLIRSASSEMLNLEGNGTNHIQDHSWLNKMLGLFIQEWPKSAVFKDKMTKAVFKVLNRRKRKFVQQIQVKDVTVEPKAPEIRKIAIIPSESTEVICDFEIAYKGGVFVEIETKLEPEGLLNVFGKDYFVSAKAKILLKRLNGKIRLCWRLPGNGPSWIAFIGEPAVEINVDPLLGNNLFNVSVFPQVESILRKAIAKKLRKLTYPNQKIIKFPLSEIAVPGEPVQ